MQSKEANYFTAGELAAIFSISKQTLLYYDKIGYYHQNLSAKMVIAIIQSVST